MITRRHKGDLICLLLMATSYFLAIKLHQWHAFDIHSELADFEFLLWNTLHGDPLLTDPHGTTFFSQHVSPILYLLIPIYAMFSSPVTLLVLQALAASAAVLPLYLLVIEEVHNRISAVSISVAFIVSRTLHYGLMYDFHMEIFYPLLFFTAFLLIQQRRWTSFSAMFLLALAVKEDAAIAGIGVGLWLFASNERRKGSIVLLASVIWLATCFFVIFPTARSGAREEYGFVSYWSGYGDDLHQVFRNMLDPRVHMDVLFTKAKLSKAFNMFSVFAFLPLLNWRAALFLVLPCWFILYSSSNSQLWGSMIYYGLLILPMLFYASLLSVKSITNRVGRNGHRIATILCLLVLLVHLANSRIFKQMHTSYWDIEPRFTTAEALIEHIPTNSPVAAQVDLQSHVPVRRGRFLIPFGIAFADYLLFDLEGNSWPLSQNENRQLADSLRTTPTWESVTAKDGFLLLSRSETR